MFTLKLLEPAHRMLFFHLQSAEVLFDDSKCLQDASEHAKVYTDGLKCMFCQ